MRRTQRKTRVALEVKKVIWTERVRLDRDENHVFSSVRYIILNPLYMILLMTSLEISEILEVLLIVKT